VRKLGSIVHRGELYGVVIALGNPHWNAVRVEWSNGTREWVEASDVEWSRVV
jgi:hypothetical protein